MGTIMEYLAWRGDLSFSKDPLNDIDTLILALLSYLPFKDIVPGVESNQAISLKDTSAQFFLKNSNKNAKSPNINPTASLSMDSELLELLRATAGCRRFEKIQLSKYNENTDFVVGQQFGAVTFSLPDAKIKKVIAFRGTDNSMIGWKEDLEIAYMEQIPAQESASKYLDRAVGILTGKVIVCGHSKGGNLAVYAGSRLKFMRRNKLAKIINFDGPGFDFSINPKASFSSCEHKVHNYVPEESIVGMLLEPVGERTVVSSSAWGINQHNALNWRVEQSNFEDGNLSGTTKLLEHTLTIWLAELPVPKRKLFIEALFDILGTEEGRTIDPRQNIKEIKNIMTKYSKLDEETKTLLTDVFSSLTEKTKNTLSTTIKENLPKMK
jgi:hypothetical protein